jgi:hypothetical protein
MMKEALIRLGRPHPGIAVAASRLVGGELTKPKA